MKFYKSISESYDYIFPYNPKQKEFVLSKAAILKKTDLSILDIGCGTGNLTIEIAGGSGHITGIDLNEEMVELARAKSDKMSNIEMFPLNMLDILERFGEDSKDVIFSFGNTLVHLTEEKLFETFFHRAYKVLKENSTLLLQIINYDRILDNNIKGLSTIENEHIKFERVYDYENCPSTISFDTVLTLKESGLVKKNSVPLFPLRKSKLEYFLKNAGFDDISFYGGFDQSEFSKDSVALVVSAMKV